MRSNLSALDTALDLLKRGLWPVVLHPLGVEIPTKDGTRLSKGKEPIGSAWGVNPPDAVKLRALFRAHPGAGVGLRLGPEGGVIDLEGDGPEAEASLTELFGGEVIETMGWSSRRGPHRLFRWDDRLAALGKVKTVLPDFPGLEIRTGLAGRQAQSACPPTPGEDGTPRCWGECDAIAALPEGAIRRLLDAAAWPTEAPSPNRATTKGKPGDPAAAWFRKALDSEAGRVAMAPEGGRNDALHRAAATLGGYLHHGHLTAPEAEAALTEAGRRAGLEPGELAATIASGFRYGSANPLPWPEKLTRPAANADGRHHGKGRVTGPEDDDKPLPRFAWPAPPGGAAFHGIAGQAVRLIEEHTEADPLGILAQILVGFGNAAGRGPHLVVDGARHGTNEFLVVVGETASARKGTSWARAKQVLHEADPAWCRDRLGRGLSSGEGVITPVRDPVLRGGECLDEGEADKRLLIVETEFGSVLRSLQREGNRLSAILRSAWDGDDLATMTKSPLRATEPHISVIGHITFGELSNLLSGVDVCNGLANRIVWLCVRRARVLPFGGAEIDLAPIQEQFRAALHFARGVGKMGLSPPAQKAFASVYGRLSTPPPGVLGEVTSRAPAHVLRWSMLCALIDRSPVVGEAHVVAATEMIDASNRAAAHIFGDALGHPLADRILAALRESDVGLSRTEINRVVFNGHEKAERIREALAFLVRHGMAREERIPTVGADRLVYHACGKSEKCETRGRAPEVAPLSSLIPHSDGPDGRSGREVIEL